MSNASVALLPGLIPEFYISGIPATGGKLFTYAAGTTTKLATYTDGTGSTPQTNPIILNSRGEPQNGAASVGIWPVQGVAYKYVFSPSSDTDPPTAAIWTLDNVIANGSGGGSGSSASVTPESATFTAVAGSSYGIHTSAAAVTINLPPISVTADGAGVLIVDIDNAASTNNITVAANGSDSLSYFARSGGTFTIATDGAAVQIVKSGSVWRIIALGG